MMRGLGSLARVSSCATQTPAVHSAIGSQRGLGRVRVFRDSLNAAIDICHAAPLALPVPVHFCLTSASDAPARLDRAFTRTD
jgi:hypothetical protein